MRNKLEKLKSVKEIVFFSFILRLTNCQDGEISIAQEQLTIMTVNIEETKSILTLSKNEILSKLFNDDSEDLELDKIT